MLMKHIPRLILLALLSAAVSSAFAQVNPAATSGGTTSVPLVIGVGYSNFTMDWGPSHRSNGISAFVDLYPFPGAMKDLGLEAEGRASRWGNPVPNLREDTGQFGVIYSVSQVPRIHPFGKFLAGVGSMDFPAFATVPNYKHDTFAVTSMAGGADMQVYGHFYLRAEYQYQWWHNVFGPGHTFTPNGITIGGVWDFRSLHSKY
jgi:hypothetical protein